MAIHILTGRPGTGKTYILTAKALEFLKKGRNVWINYFIDTKGLDLKGKLNFYTKISDIVKVKEGIILMDEAQIYFNSRNWEVLDERLQYKLQQHRHQGLDIWGTVQNIKRLDVIMRELVSNYYECHRLFATGEGSKHPFGLFFLREYDVKDADKPEERRHMFSFDWYWLHKDTCQRYDTLMDFTELIENYKESKGRIITREYKVCETCGNQKRIS